MAFAISCTEEIKPTKYSYSQLLTGKNNKTWKLNKIALRKAGEEDDTFSRNDCESDDRYIFYANEEKLFEVRNGDQRCDADEESLLLSYQWAFSNANANITMVMPHVFGYFLIPFIVKNIDASDMELELFLDEEATVSYVFFFKRTDEE
jgi:hypothetical protein